MLTTPVATLDAPAPDNAIPTPGRPAATHVLSRRAIAAHVGIGTTATILAAVAPRSAPGATRPGSRGAATQKRGLYVLQNVVPSAIAAATQFDVKVIEVTRDGANDWFTRAEVTGMKSAGAPVIGYFSLGEAENYRDYWNAALAAGIVGPVDPDWPGNFEVAFWSSAWLDICYDYCDRMIAHGYDGIYFDVVDEYALRWAVSHVPGGTLASSANAMLTLIENIRTRAHAKAPNFRIWANGAEALLDNPRYAAAIDGMYKEEVFFLNNALQPAREYDFTARQLRKAVTAGRDVVCIEYITGAAKVTTCKSLCASYGFGYYVADPDLELDGIDFEGVS